ncbi:hypothetical protein C8J57DRAFT_1120507 [Mycena rebaudengoi]|nr:hypothetical protein C8J57DRAFT_1120507 [Mycena rebaudengoi]
MASVLLRFSGAALLLSNTALGFHHNASGAVTPIVASLTSYGSTIDTGVNRDSCATTLWSNNKILWTCRDTQKITSSNEIPNRTEIISNTASFSGFPSAKSHPQRLVLSTEKYGPLFYPLESDECPPLGLCSDGNRWVGWPDTGPVVTFRGLFGEISAYGFMQKQHLSGLDVLNVPSTSMYHVTSQNANHLPTTRVVASPFWTSTQIGYGVAASVLTDKFVYLYGGTPNRKLAVARAARTFLGSLEDHRLYEYYVNGTWTRTIPAYNDAGVVLPNTSAIQGTIYWSAKWQSFVWIGGDGFPNANFLISTALKPEGPWTAPTQFFSGAVGSGTLAAYSCVAHPAMTDGTGNYIFISYTRTTPNDKDYDVYDQPLWRVDWK